LLHARDKHYLFLPYGFGRRLKVNECRRIPMKMQSSVALVALLMGSTMVAIATPASQAQSFTVLYTFPRSGLTGANPDGTLAMDNAGTLYGTTYFGGSNTNGVVFKLNPSGNETVLVNGGPADSSYGAFPVYGVILGKAHDIFGLFQASPDGGGEIVGLRAKGKGKILYDFGTCNNNCYVPSLPDGGLLKDSSGNLYGVTYFGGVKGQGLQCEMRGCGTVYKLDTSGNFHVLYAFTGGADGARPNGSLIQDAAGNLYGAALQGGDLSCPQGLGVNGCGTVFKLAPDGTFTVLYTFTGGFDGATPLGALAMDAAGNLYGAAKVGGDASCDDGCGTLFKIASNGKFTDLYEFNGNTDGGYPNGNLVLDPKGNLYGDAQGTNGNGSYYGAVFELSAAGKFKVLHILNGFSDGADPTSGLIRDSAGNLYGSAYQGFSNSDRNGTVFKVVP
jgi:uncharacterized repeat protein (TIGR03803 family)